MKYFLTSTMLAALLALPQAAAAQQVTPQAQPDVAEVPKYGIAGDKPKRADASKEDQEQVARDSNAFAIDLYGQLRQSQTGNFMFAPSAIYTLMATAYAGSVGQTGTEIAQAMHYTLPATQFHAAASQLQKDPNFEHKNYRIRMINGVWLQTGYPFRDEYLSVMKSRYPTTFQNVDFYHAPDQAAQTANQWYQHDTDNAIQRVVNDGSFNSDARMALISAVNFAGNWQIPFLASGSYPESFRSERGEVTQAPMMHVRGDFHYFAIKGQMQVVEIPFTNNEYSLIVFLPDGLDGVKKMEQSLTITQMNEWLKRIGRLTLDVEVTLPRLDLMQSLQLKDALFAMGIQQAFDSAADFSGMFDNGQGVFLSSVLQSTHLPLAEAPPAVAAAAQLPAGQRGTKPTVEFKATQPFFFVLRDNWSGAIFMMGRVIKL